MQNVEPAEAAPDGAMRTSAERGQGAAGTEFQVRSTSGIGRIRPRIVHGLGHLWPKL